VINLGSGLNSGGRKEVGATLKKLLILFGFLALCIAGGAYWYGYARPSGPAEEGFTLASAQYATLTETVSATGILKPHEVVIVGSELSGRVIEIYPEADVNQVVEEGSPLLKLEDRKAQLDLEKARIAMDLAKANVQAAQAAKDGASLRVKRLSALPPEVGERKQLDEAELQLKAADATVKAAQVKVEEAQNAKDLAQYGVDLTVIRVRSETSNRQQTSARKRQFTILERKVFLGQLIAPPASAQLFTLASDLKQMQVHTQVSENDIGKVRLGLDATFTVFAYAEDETKFKGKVAEIRPMPASEHGAVFYDTVVEVTNERDPKTNEWKLRPGMTASVDLILRRHPQVWQVPNAALSLELDEHFQTEAAREKLARWRQEHQQQDWRPVWTLNGQGRPWPVFARIGGKSPSGEAGISDGQSTEVLEWEPDLEPRPNPKVLSTYPQVITGAPSAPQKGIFDQPPKVRVF
jgi:HlyD family secretion protein